MKSMSIRHTLSILLSILSLSTVGDGDLRRNPPSECKVSDSECQCETGEVGSGCIKVSLGMGATTPWTDSRKCALKVFADMVDRLEALL